MTSRRPRKHRHRRRPRPIIQIRHIRWWHLPLAIAVGLIGAAATIALLASRGA